MQTNKKRTALLAGAIIALAAVLPVAAMLQVSVANTGIVVGQTKELTIFAGANGVVSGTVQLLGTGVVLPTCATALAASFADVATASISWGASLQSNTDYELFFCLGNIGSSAGTVHVSTTGQATGETEVFEQASAGLIGGLVYSPCDGASIVGGGVIAVRGRLHTPTVGLNGSVSITGKTTFTFS